MVLALVASGAPAAAADLASPWAVDRAVQARLISGATALGEAGPVSLGLHIELDKGWKTYWRSPGDSGLPPLFDWSKSENLAAVEVRWPAPLRFDEPGDLTHGYKNEIVLPLRAVAADRTKPLQLNLMLDYAICLDVCIPVQAVLSLTVPHGVAAPSVYAGLIETYVAQVPQRLPEKIADRIAGQPAMTARLLMSPGTPREGRLEVRVTNPPPLEAPRLIVEGPPALSFGVPERQGDTFIVPVKGRDVATLKGLRIMMTLADTGFAIEQAARIE